MRNIIICVTMLIVVKTITSVLTPPDPATDLLLWGGLCLLGLAGYRVLKRR